MAAGGRSSDLAPVWSLVAALPRAPEPIFSESEASPGQRTPFSREQVLEPAGAPTFKKDQVNQPPGRIFNENRPSPSRPTQLQRKSGLTEPPTPSSTKVGPHPATQPPTSPKVRPHPSNDTPSSRKLGLEASARGPRSRKLGLVASTEGHPQGNWGLRPAPGAMVRKTASRGESETARAADWPGWEAQCGSLPAVPGRSPRSQSRQCPEPGRAPSPTGR